MAATTASRRKTSPRLVVVTEPPSEFYKDEGGKNNHMTVVVQLQNHSQADFAVPLRVTLYYESKERVEDRDQNILRLMGHEFEPPLVSAAAPTTSIRFRLEKVSRRKDGQRFRLMIEADPDVADEDVSSVVPCFTNPICVLSKRKHHHAGGSPDSTSSSTKRSRVSSTPQAASASAASAASAALAAAAAAASHGASLASIKDLEKMERNVTARLEKLQQALSQTTDILQLHNDRMLRMEAIYHEYLIARAQASSMAVAAAAPASAASGSPPQGLATSTAVGADAQVAASPGIEVSAAMSSLPGPPDNGLPRMLSTDTMGLLRLHSLDAPGLRVQRSADWPLFSRLSSADLDFTPAQASADKAPNWPVTEVQPEL